MITIFNGRRRGLGESPAPQVYAQIDIAFREHLHHLKGARLAILLTIALHANEDGWAWPSYAQLSRETGYDLHTIRKALAELCSLEINGQRLLLRFQPTGNGGRFESNRYLIFPTPEEVARYEGAGVQHLGARSGGGFDRRAETARRSPSCSFPTTENCTTNNNHTKPEPNYYQEEEEEEEQKSRKSRTEEIKEEISRALQENGVFPENAERIAARMAAAGLTPEEALRIYLATLRQVSAQQTLDEQAVSLAVYRLEQGIWDAGEKARSALRRARAGQDLERLEEEAQEPDVQETQQDQELEKIWQAALDELQLGLTRATFETLLRNSRLVAYDDGVLTIGVSDYARGWLETRLLERIEAVVSRVTGKPMRVQFVSEQSQPGG